MKKFIVIITTFVLMCVLLSCEKSTSNLETTTNNTTSNKPSTTINSTTEDNITTNSTTTKNITTNNNTTKLSEDDELMNKTLSLKIDNTIVSVDWLDNASVNALKELAKDGLTIETHMYGNFERVGSLGTTITSSDTRITTSPGDICLYSSNQIVLFYGSNTWSYTKLGHINLSNGELSSLLGKENVVIKISIK